MSSQEQARQDLERWIWAAITVVVYFTDVSLLPVVWLSFVLLDPSDL